MKKYISITTIFLVCSTVVLSQTKKPQEPTEPYGYLTEDVTFENTTDQVTLAGTLTTPEEGGDFPAVVLISGSGPQNRDSELLGHKSFKVIADHLTKKGIAVLRVDDRGVGESEGVHNETSLVGLKRDTESAVAYLKTRKEIDASQIGLIGHSLGGVIAPMIAQDSRDISHIILLAGTGMRGDQLMLLQKELIEREMGADEASISTGQENMKGAYDIILKSDGETPELAKSLTAYFTPIFGSMLLESQIVDLSEQLATPWLADFIKHDPAESLKKVTCPVLALNGSADLQVPAKQNLTAIQKALEENGNKYVQTTELPKLNHLFQESETGLPQEYGALDETFSTEAMEIITNWILTVTEMD